MNRRPGNLSKIISTPPLGLLLGLVFFGLESPGISHATGQVLTLDLPNGISARIFTPNYLTLRTTYHGTRGTINLDGGEQLEVITDVNDPAIANKGDGAFHPFPVDYVTELLSEIAYPGLALGVDVYVLPFPGVDIQVSSSVGRRLYLSPQAGAVTRATAAYIIAHEMGHVFQARYLPERALDGWDRYRRIRDITDRQRYSVRSSHADRPREILAEDFRVLFGGPSAHFSGYIENTTLPTPHLVNGLEAFLTGLSPFRPGGSGIVGLGNYPNPFNPSTVVHVELDNDFLAGGEQLTVRIYDVRGALVRELYAGRPNGLELQVRWDGRDHSGTPVASANYFAVARAGNSSVAHKLLMIK